MVSNGNKDMAFNTFKDLPLIPYKIIDVLLPDKTQNNTPETLQKIEDFWKLLKYPTIQCLSEPNLSYREKVKMIWRGDSLEQDYNVFLKPLIGSSLDTAQSQTQLRLYRYNNIPNDRFSSVACFEIDFLTNEKTSLVRYNGLLCERTDVMESFFLDIFNGRDLGIGSGMFEYNRELSRSCQSLLALNNSKTMYGRSLVMALSYIGGESGGVCG